MLTRSGKYVYVHEIFTLVECAILPFSRYACLVCGHGPVFDTVAVLSVHRRGRRHIQGTHN